MKIKKFDGLAIRQQDPVPYSIWDDYLVENCAFREKVIPKAWQKVKQLSKLIHHQGDYLSY